MTWLKKRKLEKELDSLLQCAKAHKANGLPPGSEHYKILKAKADDAVSQYCSVTGKSQQEARARIAGLELFDQMTAAPQAGSKAGLLILAILSPFILGLLFGLFKAGYSVVGRFL